MDRGKYRRVLCSTAAYQLRLAANYLADPQHYEPRLDDTADDVLRHYDRLVAEVVPARWRPRRGAALEQVPTPT